MVKIFYQPPPPTKPKPAPTVLNITPHRPWICPLLIVVLLLVFSVAALHWCRSSTQLLDQTLRELLAQKNEELQVANEYSEQLQTQNAQLQQQMAEIINTAQTDQETYAKVLDTLKQTRVEQQGIIEEINFYKRLLIAEDSVTGQLAIENLLIQKGEAQNQYHYQVTLTHFAKMPTVNEGKLTLEVLGTSPKQRVNFSQLTGQAFKNYKFFYFDKLTGQFTLPKTFSPAQVVVRLSPKASASTLEKTFQWANVQQQEQP